MMKKLKKVTWEVDVSGRLSQAISSGLEFCFVSDDNHQCTPFAYCKDYLQDAIQGRLSNSSKSIYGFHYSPSAKHQPSLKKLKLAIANSSDSRLREKISTSLDFMHQIESALKISKTKMSECEGPPKKAYIAGGVWLVEASRRWLYSPVMVSMYTLLLRVSFSHVAGTPFMATINDIIAGKLGAYQPNDRNQLDRAKKGIELILNKGDRKIFYKKIEKNYPKVDVYTMHNSMGICSFSEGRTATHVPHWHREV